MKSTPPTVLAVLSPPARRQKAWTWLIPECPYCHKPHTHGAGVDGTVDGHRVSHCADGNDNPGYVIRQAAAGLLNQTTYEGEKT